MRRILRSKIQTFGLIAVGVALIAGGFFAYQIASNGTGFGGLDSATAQVVGPPPGPEPGSGGATTVDLSGFAWSSNIGWISFSCGSAFGGAPQAYSVGYNAATGNLSGQAWSSNIGWISFAGTAQDSSPYGVVIDAGTGNLSGQAWSSNIGWISFDRAQAGNPPAAPLNGGSGAIANFDGANITGWARALSHGDDWDGWIKFNGPNYAVTLASTGDAFDGFAWGAEVVGWVSMSGEACGGASYGVSYDTQTQTFGGNAWSSNIGWISFDRAQTLAPPQAPYNGAEAYTAGYIYDENDFNVNPDRLVTGWARALNGKDDPNDGYDGWIKFSEGTPVGPDRTWGAGTDLNATHVVYNNVTGSCELEGWAWGGEVIGWISTSSNTDGSSSSTYGVSFNSPFCNSPPQITNLNFVDTNYCTANSSQWSFNFTWDVNDLFDNPPQAAHEIAFFVSDPDSVAYTTGEVTESHSGTASMWVNVPWNTLSSGTTYQWKARARDAIGQWSDWQVGAGTIATPANRYPTAAFSFLPAQPSEQEAVIFTDESLFYDGGGVHEWSWDFTVNANPATVGRSSAPAAQNPVTQYTASGAHTATLTAYDQNGYSCSAAQTVNINAPLPVQIEVSPE